MFYDYYLYFKAFHVVFMVTWFAGLFYIVRLYIYTAEALLMKEPEKSILKNQLEVMASRLWYIITWPGMILTTFFGILLILGRPGIMKEGWFHAKLALVVLLVIYHFSCQRILNQIKEGRFSMSSSKLRLYNELPTLFLFAIIFLVILQNAMSLVFAIGGFLSLGVLLMLGIKAYKRYRVSHEESPAKAASAPKKATAKTSKAASSAKAVKKTKAAQKPASKTTPKKTAKK